MELDLLGDRQRTQYCGELRESHQGQKVFIAGWVARRRDLGSLIFLDLRDHTGTAQIVCNRETAPEAHGKADQARPEYVLGVEGEVVLRDPATVNPQLRTGKVEVMARKVLLLNESRTPPFPLDEEARTAEETRLRYRYLDLRRSRMQQNLRLRHQASLTVRDEMSRHGFVEIETPFLTRSTPEGARDYLVPSRVHHGHFYALPQSPQLFKQILMIGGFDRYFQIVRCFRDEDLRADRQPEFTQIDVEMAFPQRAELFSIVEELMEKLFALIGASIQRPFLILSYDEAMERYGSDKPHTGFGLEWKRIALAGNVAEKIRVVGPLKALRIAGGDSISRSQVDKLQEVAQAAGVEWFSAIKIGDRGLQSSLVKALGEETVRAIASDAGAGAGDLVLLLGMKSGGAREGDMRRLDEASGGIRLELARKLDLIQPGGWHFLWVVDFPMFDYDEKEKRFAAMHHPFTSPREEDLDRLSSDPASVKARAYDLVLNGAEIGGGSIRTHRRDIQQKVFEVLGMTPEKARERFGFFLDALDYGTPPHGGIALGYDRIVALMAGESNIREVIAFPKTASAVDVMCDAPATVEPEQLWELGLEVKES
ncbi:MAG: aspartate--tRNA ligase [Terriglobia bacterium]